jgi:hypothetical protein
MVIAGLIKMVTHYLLLVVVLVKYQTSAVILSANLLPKCLPLRSLGEGGGLLMVHSPARGEFIETSYVERIIKPSV